ncbi:zf-HC2 domain-containing protein [Streptomyces sp. ZYX-F-203]
MRSLERHRDVGAYALGVLDEADAFRFEDHLAQCRRCAVEVTELGAATRQLMLYRDATPRAVPATPRLDPALLDRLLRQVSTRRRIGRRRLWLAVAASLVCVVVGPAVVLAAAHPEAAGATPIAGTDPRTGVWAELTSTDRDWGSDIALRVRNAAASRTCHLVAVGLDGSEQTITNWTMPDGDETVGLLRGAAALHPQEIARYEVRGADGDPVISLTPPA